MSLDRVDTTPQILRMARRQCNELEALRVKVRVVEDFCYDLHEALHRAVRERGGTAEDHKAVDHAIPWDFDALRRARRRKEA